MEDLLLKVGEKFIINSILGRFLDNNMLKSSQHGFIPHKSTVTNLIEYLDDVSRELNTGGGVRRSAPY